MHENIKRTIEILKKEKVDYHLLEFSADTKTAVQAAEQIKCEVAQIVKSLIFKPGEKLVLVLASGTNKVDIKKIEMKCETLVEKADADFVKQKTGFTIGGVAPIGHITETNHVFFDQDLLQFKTVWASAGTVNSVFSIAPNQLCDLTKAQVIMVR